MNKPVATLIPLAVIFAMAATACKCPEPEYYTDTFVLTDAELIEVLASLANDTGTPRDTASSTTDPAPTEIRYHTCDDVCWASVAGFWGGVEQCSEQPGDGETTFTCTMVDEGCIGGRLHEVVNRTPRARGRSPLAAWLAQMAHDEAASAAAFVALEAELRTHQAPASLRRRILEAAEDEVHHAALIRSLAEARGGSVPTPQIDRGTSRDLFSIARENAVEGCVQETWLALRAWVQARQATDPAIRAALAQIAIDETAHAELARDLDRWMRGQLDAEANDALDRAQSQAVAALVARIEGGEGPRFAEAGLPSPVASERLLRVLIASVWTRPTRAG